MPSLVRLIDPPSLELLPEMMPVKVPPPPLTPSTRLRAPAQLIPEVFEIVTLPAPVSAFVRTGLPSHKSRVAPLAMDREERLFVQMPPCKPPFRNVTPVCKVILPPVIASVTGLPLPLLSRLIKPLPLKLSVPLPMNWVFRRFFGAL